MEAKKDEKSREKKEDKSKFECNICFDDVKEPVVTRCGHLFCWSCLLSWMNRNNYQCPVCQAQISRENVIPLYGHGESQEDPRNKPNEPRPKGQRPTSDNRNNPFFRNYESRISISFGPFPFSFILPIGTSNGFFGLFRNSETTRNMTPEQRRAYTHSMFLIVSGFLMILYLILCV